MNTKTIYIAGASAEPERVKRANEAARKLGYDITCDWLAVVESVGAATPADPATHVQYALADLHGVERADVVWVLAPTSTGRGAWVELGAALTLCPNILVSGPKASACIFSELAESLPSDEDALLVLEAFAGDPPRRPHGVLVGIPTLTKGGAHRTNVLLSKLPPHWGRVVVDNGGHMAGHPNAVPRRPSVAASWNYVLGVAERLRYEITLLLNDDIVITRQGLEDLALEGAASYRRFLRNPKSQPMLVGAEPHAFAAFVMHAGLVARVGYFDENFVPAYYEDTDYVRRLDLVDGYVVQINVGAKHEAATTSRELGKKWDEVAAQSRAYFEKKWGRR